ncbi:MAG: pilus assembly protein PilP [Thermoanaerobaculales bacterium]|jgi:Tfp pilus assembly protein PilP|nr:pilus assembly protein PilP [Thermoanaerobaculales bacterium]
MNNTRMLVWVAAAAVISLAAAPVYAQESTAEPAPPVAADSLGQEEVDTTAIEQILRGEREMLQGEVFSYDPAGRRDPFRSLREGFERAIDEESEPRPPGLPGMTVDELRIEGIIDTPNGILAFVQGSDNISYILRPGTKLYDGEVKDIEFDRIVFRKQSNDPKQLKPYEDVVREIKD